MPNKTITKLIFAEPGTLSEEMFADPKRLGANTVSLLREKDAVDPTRSRYEVAKYRLEVKPKKEGEPPGVNWVSVYALIGDQKHIKSVLSKAAAIRQGVEAAQKARFPPANTKDQSTQSGSVPGKNAAKNAKRRARRKRNKLRNLRRAAKSAPVSDAGIQTEKEPQPVQSLNTESTGPLSSIA